jgi:cytochrome P450
VGVLARWAPEGTSLGGYDTSNHVVLVSPYILHVDPAVWGPDAAEWKPERWEDEQGVAANVPAYSYMPFSRGPRDCIGSRFALLEAKTIMSMLYAQFDVEYVGQGEKVMMSVTAHPKFGVPVQVTRRQQAHRQAAEQVPVAASAASG